MKNLLSLALGVHDQFGKPVHEYRFTDKESTHEINVENWNPGIYHCIVYPNDISEPQILKLIVSH